MTISQGRQTEKIFAVIVSVIIYYQQSLMERTAMQINAYQLLGNAIVIQAAKDYRIALRIQHLNPNDKYNNKEMRILQKFFYGDYIKTLTRINGAELADRIKSELIANDYKIKNVTTDFVELDEE